MAWTGNFKDQIDDLAGTLTSSDDDAIQQWLRDGCYDVLQKAIAKYGPDEVWKFTAKSVDQTSNGFDIDEIRTIAAVLRNDVYATKGKRELNHKYKDAASIYSPTDNTPIWIIDNDQIYVWPAPTPSAPANYYYIPEYVLTNYSSGTSSINVFPSEYYYYVTLFAAIKVLHRRMLDFNIATSPTFNALPVAPDVPTIDAITSSFTSLLTDAAISYTNATYSAISLIDVEAFSTAPTYTAPTTALSAIESFAAFAGTLANLTISVSAPGGIDAPSISSPGVGTIAKADITGNQPTYTKPSTLITSVPPDAPTITGVTYSTTSNTVVTAPTVSTTAYVSPAALSAFVNSFTIPAANITAPNITAEGVTTVSKPDISGDVPKYNSDNTVIGFGTGTGQQFAALAGKTITDLTVSSVSPDTPSISAITYTPASSIDIDSVPDFSVSDITVDDLAAVADKTASTSSQASVSPPVFTAPDVMGDGSILTEMEGGTITGEGGGTPDPEKWFSVLGQMIEDEEDIELANTQMQKISTFINAYQADVQNALNTFNADNAKYMQLTSEAVTNIQAQNQMAIQNMQKDLNVAQANLNKNQSVEQANQQKELQVDQANQQKALELARVKSANAQAKALQDAIQETQALMSDNNTKIQAYQAELSAYQAEVNTEIQVHTQNSTTELQLWQNQQQHLMQQHNQQVQEAINIFNAENARYQANIQAELQHAQTLASEYQKETDVAMQAKIQNYTFELQEWSQELQRYQMHVGNEVQAYQQTLARYQAEQNDSVQTANIANQAHLQQAQHDLQVAMRNGDKDVEVSIQNSVNTMQAIIQDNTQAISKYQAELSAYQAEVASEVQTIQNNVQVELQEFNKENTIFQANIQAEIQKNEIDAQEAQKEGDMTLQASIQQYNSTLQKFQADVASYQAVVNDEVAEYGQNLQKALQTWTGEQSNKIARYNAEQQDSLNKFNEANIAYQADVQKRLAEYQADIQAKIKNADSAMQVDLANQAKIVEATISDYNASIQKYQAELQKAGHDLQVISQNEQNKLAYYNSELQAYSADLSVYQADASNKLQKYQADIQAQTVDYQWLQDQYARLTREYEMAFAVPQPAQG